MRYPLPNTCIFLAIPEDLKFDGLNVFMETVCQINSRGNGTQRTSHRSSSGCKGSKYEKAKIRARLLGTMKA